MKQSIRRALGGAGRLATILLAGIVAGYMLLLAVFALPVDNMEKNVLLSMPTFSGEWGKGEESYEQLLKSYRSTQLDNSTDALMMLTAIHRSSEPLTKRAANVYAYAGESGQSYLSLQEFAQKGTGELRTFSLTRYWLGYLVTLKPLLMVCTYMDIRMLNMLLQGALMVAILYMLQRRGLSRHIPAYGLALACVSPFIMPFSLQFSTVFYVLSAAMLAMLLWPKFVFQKLGDTAFFLLIGMLTCYLDFLTYPIATFGMPFVLALLIRDKQGEQTSPMRMLVRLLIAWGVGYGGMWAGKWLIALVFSGEPFWQTVVGKVLQRTSAEVGGETLTTVDVLHSVLSVFFKKPYLLLGLVAAGGYGVALVRARHSRRQVTLSTVAALVCTALLPVVWYLFTSNHTYNHAFFTSRGLCVTAFALCSLLGLLSQRKSEGNGRKP